MSISTPLQQTSIINRIKKINLLYFIKKFLEKFVNNYLIYIFTSRKLQIILLILPDYAHKTIKIILEKIISTLNTGIFDIFAQNLFLTHLDNF